MGYSGFDRNVLGIGGTSDKRRRRVKEEPPAPESREVADGVLGLTYTEVASNRRLQQLSGEHFRHHRGAVSREVMLSLEHIPKMEEYQREQALAYYAVRVGLVSGVRLEDIDRDFQKAKQMRIFRVHDDVILRLAQPYKVPPTSNRDKLFERISLVDRIDHDCPGFRDTVLVAGRESKNRKLIIGRTSMGLGPGDGSMMGGVSCHVEKPNLAHQTIEPEVEMALYAFMREILDAEELDNRGRLILSGNRRVESGIKNVLMYGNSTVNGETDHPSHFQTAVYRHPQLLGGYTCVVITVQENGPGGVSKQNIFFSYPDEFSPMQDKTRYAQGLRFI